MEEQKNKAKSHLFFPIFLALAIVAGMFLGSLLSWNSSMSESNFSFGFGKSDKLKDVLNYIESAYVDSVTFDQLTEDAISSLLEKLDPHSAYISAADFKEANESLKGSFEGIGVEFRIQRDTVTVINVIAGGPSEEKGVIPGDRIVKVNGENIASVKISNARVLKLLKGPKGTDVKISVFRHGEKDLLEITITRDVIPTYSLDIAYMVSNDIGYIKLNKFSSSTYDEFIKGLTSLKEKGATKLILDLRDNGGGYMKAAIDLADEFLKEDQVIVYTKGVHRPKDTEYATKDGLFEKGALVILIDEFSASASEIVAGAIQDNDRGTIIGRRSFGKGLVQEQIQLFDSSAIRLTIARYYTPTGRCIQNPYDDGTEAYYNDFYQRFLDGETENPDSIKFADSLKYTTPKGKIVYGGGGIMPDVFVALGKDENSKYFSSLINKGILLQFGFEYADENRSSLKSTYKKSEDFISDFIINEAIFEALIQYAVKNGIDRDSEGVTKSEASIKTYLKAFIGRNLFDDEAFYPILHKADKTMLKAIEILESEK